MFFRRFFGKYRVGVELLQTLISRIASHERARCHRGVALLKQTKVVHPASPKGSCNYVVFLINDYLRFKSVPLLFTGIMLSLLVFSPLF